MKISIQILITLSYIILVSCNPPSGNVKSENNSSNDSLVAGQSITANQSQIAGDTTIRNNQVKQNISQLEGDWLRTDGGKTIRIKGSTPDGKLDAEYFNPKPIHVGKAEWLINNNSLVVIVELQDVNYPGSRYALEYFPVEDELVGVYYQAVDKESYNVGFVRQK